MHHNDVNNERFARFDTPHCHRDGLILLTHYKRSQSFVLYSNNCLNCHSTNMFSLLHLLFQKRAHDHADGACSGLGCWDSIHSLIFVLCLAVDFPKVNTPLTMFLLPCAQPYSLIFIHFTISVMADNMAASNVKIGG